MYSNKQHINLLTSQLIEANITDIVVCPGSRNAPLVHNFYEATTQRGCFHLHPVTDERSAAFFAIGIWLATHKPVAVCVTSGSALLNTLPAVAEAYYRQIPLVIISADRPPQWIGQLDGQTIQQIDALFPYAPCIEVDEHPSTVTVPAYNPLMPLHLNVPISEPLFDFTTQHLPQPDYSYFEQWPQADNGIKDLQHIVELINQAQLPAVIIGQYEHEPIESLLKLDKQDKLLLLPEIISNHPGSERTTWIEALKAQDIPMPDLVIHIGGALVNKWLKLKLRQQENLKVIRVDQTDDCPDTFSHLEIKVKYNEAKFFDTLLPLLKPHKAVEEFKQSIGTAMIKPKSTKAQAISMLWQQICNQPKFKDTALFLGNSTAVRAATRSIHSGVVPTYCNRGTNGIEGSLSVAAGYSAVSDKIVYAIVGDLSFFYDVNALWNDTLRSNLRILLINDHWGGIFSRLPNLNQSPALDKYISAHHHTSAQGIAQSYHCSYLRATDMREYLCNLPALVTPHATTDNDKPIILELEYDTHLEQN